jgi:hypothetical protein
MQTRACTDSNGCGTTAGEPATEQACAGVEPGGSCSATMDCDQSTAACSAGMGALCVDWGDGAGPECQCECGWGTDCHTGCCSLAVAGAVQLLACAPSTSCVALGGLCSVQYQCENDCGGSVGSDKSYCVNSLCSCGCTASSQCVSDCCVQTNAGVAVCQAALGNVCL